MIEQHEAKADTTTVAYGRQNGTINRGQEDTASSSQPQHSQGKFGNQD